MDVTGQPYVFVNDNPLNTTDPLGQCWFACGVWHNVTSAADHVGNFVKRYRSAIILAGVTILAGSVTFGLGAAILPTEFAVASEVFGSAAVEASSSSVGVALMHGAEVISTASDWGATAIRLGAPFTLTVISAGFTVHEAIVAHKGKQKKTGNARR